MFRSLRLVWVPGVLVLLFALVAPASAQQDSPDGPTMDWDFDNVPRSFVAGPNAIYYPWVANDDDFGLGEADTSISVQNLEDRDGQIWIYRGNGNNSWTLAATAALSAYASKTFTAGQLGIASGEGAPVAVVGFSSIAVPGDELPWGGIPASTTTYVETVVVLSNPLNPGDGVDQVVACVANNAAGNPSPFRWMGDTAILDAHPIAYFTASNGDVWVTGDWDQTDLQELLNAANVDNDAALINPFGGLNGDGDCNDALTYRANGISLSDGMAIGGVAKMAAAGNTLPFTTSADTAVSGYNAINGLEVDRFNEWYLPIVQTNCGPGGCWNSIIRVANLADHNSAVTVRFFAADDGSGSLQTGFQVQLFLNGGQTDHINLGDYVPEGWVGSAHIYSDGWVFAMVDRYKVGYDMWLTNTGSASEFEQAAQWETWITTPPGGAQYALFAPSVMSDWFGWNTGINVANLVNADNNVSIQYFNLFGNATQGQSKRLAPHGMTYFYDPSDLGQNISTQNPQTDPNPGVVGSAIIWSDHPVAAAVNATKYPETSPGTSTDWFQATTYNATQNIYTFQAIPLVQKGNPASGMGATSGINILNPNAVAAQANVYWVNPSGFNASNFGVSTITIPAYSNGFVYTMFHHNLPNGFVGAAQVISNVPVAAVSANVDYQVDGDGSAMFNAFNHCGFYRTTDVGDDAWECFFGDPLETTGQSVAKTFVDEWGDPVQGVNFHIVNDNPDFDPARYATSNAFGEASFGNVPVGNYELVVDSVPDGYLMPENPADEFTLHQGEDEELFNTLYFAQGVQKTVIVAGTEDQTLGGINVAIYQNTGTVADPVLGSLVPLQPGDNGETGPDGVYSRPLPQGSYILCIWNVDLLATLPDGEPVIAPLNNVIGTIPAFFELMLENGECEPFDLEAGDPDEFNTVELRNEVSILGVLNGFVFHVVNPEVPLEDVEICLTPADFYDNGAIFPDDYLCTTSNADGQFAFSNLGATDYVMLVRIDGFIVSSFEGGTLTVVPDATTPITEDSVPGTMAILRFSYDPVADLLQDGSVNELAFPGSNDIRIEVEESPLILISKTVTVNGEDATPELQALVILRITTSGSLPIVDAGPTTQPEDAVFPGNFISVVPAEGEAAWFVVDGPGEYELCSYIHYFLNPDSGENDQFPYNDILCETFTIGEDDFATRSFQNDHQFVEVTKQVMIGTECELTGTGEYACEGEALYEGEGATLALTLGLSSGDWEGLVDLPVVDGSVRLIVPAYDDLEVTICTTIVDNELSFYPGQATQCDDPVEFSPAVNGELTITNVHPTRIPLLVGQLDVGWNPDQFMGFIHPANMSYCLKEQDGIGFEQQCVSPFAHASMAPDLGIFFTDVPAGDYYIEVWSGVNLIHTTPDFVYDPQLDADADGDVVDIIRQPDLGDPPGFGDLTTGHFYDILFFGGLESFDDFIPHPGYEGVLNVLVLDESAQPVAGAEVCLDWYIPVLGVGGEMDCHTSDANGNVAFVGTWTNSILTSEGFPGGITIEYRLQFPNGEPLISYTFSPESTAISLFPDFYYNFAGDVADGFIDDSAGNGIIDLTVVIGSMPP